MTVSGGLLIFSKFMSIVSGQVGTTANVTVSGCLEYLNVSYSPVNFSGDAGVIPGSVVSKVNANGVGYIIIDMTVNTNIAWDAYMNASDLIPVNGVGARISPKNITVWSQGCPIELPATSLDYNLKKLCTEIPYNSNFNLYFNLTLPVGWYNNTYYGNLTIFVNSSHTAGGTCPYNATWNGPNNTTVKIKTNIEFWWNANTVPINFQTLSPGTGFCGPLGCTPSANATINKGFPANMTVGDNTNIYTDIYMMGTDLTCNGPGGDQCWGPPIWNISIGPTGNLTYSNATTNTTWPSKIKFVNYSYQAPPYLGDFLNWHHVKNYTDVPSFWNISIPSNTKQGSYGGGITAKAVDEGTPA